MKYSNLILISIVFVLLGDALRILINSSIIGGGATELLAAIFTFSAILVLIYLPFTKKIDLSFNTKTIYYSWLILTVLNVIRGFIVVDDYFDTKYLILVAIPFTFIAFTFYLGESMFFFQKILRFFLRYLFPMSLLILPVAFVTNPELYSRLMSPISFFIILFPFVNFRWKLTIIVVSILCIFSGLSNRTGLIKIIFSILLLGLFYFRNVTPKLIIKVSHMLLFIIPIFLIFLGLTGRYNIFKEMSKNDSYTSKGIDGNEESMAADTRTFLYSEVISSVRSSGNWIFGESPGGTYTSYWFHMERNASEVGILNIFLYYGLFGLIIYFILLFKVSLDSIINSNNFLFKMIGLIIASRWCLSFIEEFTQFDINFFFFWLFMGIASNTLFLKMNDKQVRFYLRQL